MVYRDRNPPPPPDWRDPGRDIKECDAWGVVSLLWRAFLVIIVVVWAALGVAIVVAPQADTTILLRQWILGGLGLGIAIGFGWPLGGDQH